MAWQARLQSVPTTNDAGADSFFVEIEYFDTATSRSFVQSLKFTAGTTLEEAQAQVAARVAALTTLDATKEALLPFVGQIVA